MLRQPSHLTQSVAGVFAVLIYFVGYLVQRGYRLGIVEVIATTIFIGFACDYCVRVRATPGGRCPRGARARRHGLCGEPAYAELRRTRRGRATRTGTRVERVNGPGGEPEIPSKNPPHTSVLVRGVGQRRRAP